MEYLTRSTSRSPLDQKENFRLWNSRVSRTYPPPAFACVPVQFLVTFSRMLQKTRAHHRLKDDVPEDVKSRRHHELCDTFRKESEKLNQAQIGQLQLILIEGVRMTTATGFCFPNTHKGLHDSSRFIALNMDCRQVNARIKRWQAETTEISKLSYPKLHCRNRASMEWLIDKYKRAITSQ